MAIGGDCYASVMHRESPGASMTAGGRHQRRKVAEMGCRRRISDLRSSFETLDTWNCPFCSLSIAAPTYRYYKTSMFGMDYLDNDLEFGNI